MKLPIIHQLHHFVEQIYDFGSASNVSGRIGESNLKSKEAIGNNMDGITRCRISNNNE